MIRLPVIFTIAGNFYYVYIVLYIVVNLKGNDYMPNRYLIKLEDLNYWVDRLASPGDVAMHYDSSTDLTYVYEYEGPDKNPQWMLFGKKPPVLEELPAVEGKWIPVSQKPGVHAGMKCSICKAKISYKDYYGGQHRYCYKCGAKMTKED